MHALRILQHGAFSPAGVERLQAAFDKAWLGIEPDIDAQEKDKARESLAIVVVSAGNVSDLDADELAQVALRLFRAIAV
jgi:phosphoglycerate dehydrogenase-like enzyme